MKVIYYTAAVVCVIAGAAVANFNLRPNANQPAAPQVKVQFISYEEYQQRLLQLLGQYPAAMFKTKTGAAELRTALLAMDHLPPAAQPTQLLLVLAADKIIAGQDEESRVILEELNNQYPWLQPWLKA